MITFSNRRCRFQELFEATAYRYQKKIGTYDKQQWEKTVEQRILSGFTHVPKKTAKLKPELIDVDLVRGSAFSKAKPKHGLVTVTRLAVCRMLFVPLYSRWWAQQTSPRVFVLLLTLYLLQLFNIGLYFYVTSAHDDETVERVTVAEVLVPAAMMLVLSVIHSQIISPNGSITAGSNNSKVRRLKRTKRRSLPHSRSRTLVCSDSKSSPVLGSELNNRSSDPVMKFNKHVRLRKSSKEDVTLSTHDHSNSTGVAKPLLEYVYLEQREASSGSLLGNVEGNDTESQGSRERTPQDDDGFESLNGNGSSDNNEECNRNKSESSVILSVHFPADSVPEDNQKTDKMSGKNSKIVYSTKNIDIIKEECESVRTSLMKCDTYVNNNILDANNTKNEATVNCNFKEKNINEENCYEELNQSVRWKERDRLPLEDMFRNEWVTDQPSCRLPSGPGTVSSGEVDHETDHKDTDSDPCDQRASLASQVWHSVVMHCMRLVCRRRGSQANLHVSISGHNRMGESSFNSSGESEEGETGSFCPHLTEGTTSAAEWIGITTNSEECSYSSDMDDIPLSSDINDHPFPWEFQMSPSVILSPSCAASDKVSCTMWEKRDVKKADLSVLDISSAIIARVEAMPEQMEFFYAGMVASVLLAAIPSIHRLVTDSSNMTTLTQSDSLVPAALNVNSFDFIRSILSTSLGTVIDSAFGSTLWERCVILIALLERCVLAGLFFFLLAVAERTFKQRFLYAKFFSHLTSFRRARKSELPHFRLNKVRNIKTWLSVRSYLKKRGPQRSVDMIVSAVFLITLLLLSFVSVEFLKDSVRLHVEYNVEALAWCIVLGFFLLRFMTLGDKINRKYRNLSVLITEQINLYLQIEQKPNKKEELMVANSVLKLAADLLKELESPFKISGVSANPYLYTITKVVILSALSGVLSEMLGFKLKLHKIKIK
ncbi:putative homeodomain transcription factor isoform X2 [Lycorma delicatula]|uniref:putative homeodomain transcription factor isoform X2 n=1 Tax=Lycorma delicatula TaxID=130591 RepID=UPI003F519DFB